MLIFTQKMEEDGVQSNFRPLRERCKDEKEKRDIEIAMTATIYLLHLFFDTFI